MAKELALSILQRLKSLPPRMAESFAKSFAKGVESLITQQDKQLATRQDFLLMLLEPLIEETPLQYKKGKIRAITGLEVAEERERDASRQHRRDERAAAALVAADTALKAQEEQDLVEAAWVADTQLQLSQLSYLDADDSQLEDADGDQQEQSSSLSDATSDASDNENDAGPSCQLGSQAQPLEISSSDESGDSEPRRSGRVRRATRIVESQLSQIEKGIIPAPGARARARALNAKKQNTKASQLEHEFKLIE